MNDLIGLAVAVLVFTPWLLIIWNWLDPIRKEEATPAVPPKQRHFILFYSGLNPYGGEVRGHINLTDIVFPNENALVQHIGAVTGSHSVFIENVIEVTPDDFACWVNEGLQVDEAGNMKLRFKYRSE